MSARAGRAAGDLPVVLTLGAVEELEREECDLADLLEFRLDLDPRLGERIADCPRPVLATLRSESQGGGFRGRPHEARPRLEAALRAGAMLIDVELLRDDPGDFPADHCVRSHHELHGTPPELDALVQQLASTRPAVAKLAVTPRSGPELLRLLLAMNEARGGDVPVALMGMGSMGTVTRVLARKLGSALVFASLPGETPRAPGQVDIQTLVRSYAAHRLEPNSPVRAVIGSPLGHTASPALHNAALPETTPRAVFLPLELPELGSLEELVDRLDVVGLAVTHPHKTKVAGALGRFDIPSGIPLNTAWRKGKGSRWELANTDRTGASRALELAGLDLAGERAIVLGAGGAARAGVEALLDLGARVRVRARQEEAARSLARSLGVEWGPWPPSPSRAAWAHASLPQPEEAAVVVNATPLGMLPAVHGFPCAPKAFGSGAVLFDMVYNPRWTRWLAAGRFAGQGVVPGEEMFLEQALEQERLWCGTPGDRARALAAVRQRVSTGLVFLWLVGLRGSGKSSVARVLSRRLGLPAIDLDHLVTERTGRTPADLIRADGESAFRRQESRALRHLIATTDDPTIVATGGGIVLHHAAELREHGLVVHLDGTPEVLAGRIQADTANERPPLTSAETPLTETRRLSKERASLYARASSMRIDTSMIPPETVADRIMQWCAQGGGEAG